MSLAWEGCATRGRAAPAPSISLSPLPLASCMAAIECTSHDSNKCGIHAAGCDLVCLAFLTQVRGRLQAVDGEADGERASPAGPQPSESARLDRLVEALSAELVSTPSEVDLLAEATQRQVVDRLPGDWAVCTVTMCSPTGACGGVVAVDVLEGEGDADRAAAVRSSTGTRAGNLQGSIRTGFFAHARR